MKRININRIKLTRQEREIEDALLRGEYVRASKNEFNKMARALARRRKPGLTPLTETLEIITDKRLMASIRQGLKETRAGKLIPWDRVKQKLDRKK